MNTTRAVMAAPVASLVPCENAIGYASGSSGQGAASSQLGGSYTVRSSTSRMTAAETPGVMALNWYPPYPPRPFSQEV